MRNLECKGLNRNVEKPRGLVEMVKMQFKNEIGDNVISGRAYKPWPTKLHPIIEFGHGKSEKVARDLGARP